MGSTGRPVFRRSLSVERSIYAAPNRYIVIYVSGYVVRERLAGE
jgi:hypothetical protein